MHVMERDTSAVSTVYMQSARMQPQPPSPSLTPPAPEGTQGLSPPIPLCALLPHLYASLGEQRTAQQSIAITKLKTAQVHLT